MRDDYLKEASKIINDANTIVNLVSKRVKQLKNGAKPLIHSLEKLDLEDIALKEIIDGKLEYSLYESETE